MSYLEQNPARMRTESGHSWERAAVYYQRRAQWAATLCPAAEEKRKSKDETVWESRERRRKEK